MSALRLAYRESAHRESAHREFAYRDDEVPTIAASRDRLAGLADLGSADIETSLVASLSGDLHNLFDPVCDDVLPIYFGPLLGRLYLEGL